MEIAGLNLAELFEIKPPVLELVLRGTCFYFGILFLLRMLPRRTGGELAVMDLIFVLLVAEAATHSLGGYDSVTEGFIVIVTLMAWNFSVNWLSYHVPSVEKLFSAAPLQIVKAGKLLKKNMRREYVTEEELMDSLRKEGMEDINQVEKAYVESDGRISFIKRRSRP